MAGTVRAVQHAHGVVRLAVLAAALAAVSTACAADGTKTVAAPSTTAAAASGAVTDGSAPAPTGGDSAPTTTAANAAVPESLRFSAPGVGGTSIDFAQFAGSPLVLWFWAPG